MTRRTRIRLIALGLSAALVAAGAGHPAATAEPKPGSLAYQLRDVQNMHAAYGRIHGPGGQLRNPAYLPALVESGTEVGLEQLLQQVATPTRLAVTPGQWIPGWNVGNPLRAGWEGSRGIRRDVTFTNRYGALLRGSVWAPRPGASDPYTGRELRGPFPGVVITTGSVQGSQGMYEWLAQDLAERGYVVLTYDVQGQGESETLPHEGQNALPFCNPFAEPHDGEQFGCPGVPAQQLSNFVVGTEDALDFFTSTPEQPYGNPGAAGADVSSYNPLHDLWDRSPDPTPATPGRTTRIAIIGHSMGAAAVSKVQATDDRVAAVVALDKLSAQGSGDQIADSSANVPSVPALALQAEYGFTVSPWFLSGGSSLRPSPSPQGPDRLREKQTGYDGWREAGKDVMLVVPRASTHLEWTDIPLALPASRHGQALSSVYTQAWLDRYLKHRSARPLLARELTYLEPVGNGRWEPVTLQRDALLSFYYCSAYSLSDEDGPLHDGDLADLGGCGD